MKLVLIFDWPILQALRLYACGAGGDAEEIASLIDDATAPVGDEYRVQLTRWPDITLFVRARQAATGEFRDVMRRIRAILIVYGEPPRTAWSEVRNRLAHESRLVALGGNVECP